MLVTWSTRLRHNEKAAVCDRLEAQSELYEKRLTDDIEVCPHPHPRIKNSTQGFATTALEQPCDTYIYVSASHFFIFAQEVLSRGSGMQSVIFLYSDEAGNNMCIPSPPLPQFSG